MRSGLTVSLLAFTALAVLALLAGCGEETPAADPEDKIVYRDTPVDLEDTEWTPPIEGDPALTVGVTEDQLFRELVDGDDAPIIEGFQGGFWVHISLRTTGLGRSGRIDGRLVVDDEDDPVGKLAADLRMTPTREGFFERSQVPIALGEAWQEHFADLYDRAGRIEVSYTDEEGRVAERIVKVTFVEN